MSQVSSPNPTSLPYFFPFTMRLPAAPALPARPRGHFRMVRSITSIAEPSSWRLVATLQLTINSRTWFGNECEDQVSLRSCEHTKWLWVKNRHSKWVALNGNMDPNLRSIPLNFDPYPTHGPWGGLRLNLKRLEAPGAGRKVSHGSIVSAGEIYDAAWISGAQELHAFGVAMGNAWHKLWRSHFQVELIHLAMLMFTRGFLPFDPPSQQQESYRKVSNGKRHEKKGDWTN